MPHHARPRAEIGVSPSPSSIRVCTPRGVATSCLVAVIVAAVAVLIGMAPADARQGESSAERRLEVEVTARGDAPRRNIVTVDVDGLAPFADGTLVVYQCGNADSAGRPIEPTEDDCFAPDDDGYLTTPIGDESSVTVRYRIARRDIGANAARCIPALDGAAPCQLVIGAVDGSDAEIVGVALDDALADLDEAAAAGRPEGPAAGDEPATSLPVTGVGSRSVAIGLFVAAGCLYVGSLLRSSTRAV